MKKRCFALFVFLITLLFSGFITLSNAADLNSKVSGGQLVQKVDAFLIITDTTFSMNDLYRGQQKLSFEKGLISLLNQTIPDLKFNSGMRIFGQTRIFWPSTSALVYGITGYSKAGIEDALKPLQAMGESPLHMAIDGAAGDLKNQGGQMAVIVFSDGEDMDSAPVVSASNMKSQYGDRVCIYTVQIGDSIAGSKILQQVAQEGRCGFYVKGDDINSAEGMADFVEKVLLKRKTADAMREAKVEREAAPMMEAKKAPAAAMELNVQFASGKSAIQPKYHKEIKKLADFMKKYPETKAVIEGHTDNVGKEAANVKLSQARANSIKNYIVKNFKVDSSRLEAVGYGPKKPVASNDTAAGRQKNRRVFAVINK